MYERAEEADRVEAQTKALEESNRLNEEQIDLRRGEYRRRYFSAGLGLQENERLKRRVAELEEQLRTLSARGIDSGTFDDSGVRPTLEGKAGHRDAA